jgi:hypothetical protein
MRLRTSAWMLVAAVGLSFLGFETAARADGQTDATGTWTWEFQRPNGGDKVKMTLKLKQEGEKLTGTFIGFNGNETEIKDGSAKDGKISFSVTRERNGQTFTTKYSGKVEGDTIKGKSEREVNGETQSRDWEAKRS